MKEELEAKLEAQETAPTAEQARTAELEAKLATLENELEAERAKTFALEAALTEGDTSVAIEGEEKQVYGDFPTVKIKDKTYRFTCHRFWIHSEIVNAEDAKNNKPLLETILKDYPGLLSPAT